MSGASRQKTVLSQASPGEKSTRKRKEKRAPHPLAHPAGLAANRAGMEPLPGWGTAWFSDLIESAQPLPGAWLGNKCKFGMESARRRWWDPRLSISVTFRTRSWLFVLVLFFNASGFLLLSPTSVSAPCQWAASVFGQLQDSLWERGRLLCLPQTPFPRGLRLLFPFSRLPPLLRHRMPYFQ